MNRSRNTAPTLWQSWRPISRSLAAWATALALLGALPNPLWGGETWLAPTAIAIGNATNRLFIACAETSQVMEFDLFAGKIVGTIDLPDAPSGLALSRNGAHLYVTCAAAASTVVVIDPSRWKVVRRIPCGHTALAPVLSPDGRTLYVCARFNNQVFVLSLPEGKISRRIDVPREPVAAAVTPDGRWLVVANHLHDGPANAGDVAALVSLVNPATGDVIDIRLPNGSGLLRGVAISPDGRYAAVTHVLARHYLPTTQVDRGWMNSNALTLIDLAKQTRLNTVLLDEVDHGAANPWAVAWTTDGTSIVVTQAGTHELSVIDAPALLRKLAGAANQPPAAAGDTKREPGYAGDQVPNDLAFLVGLRRRIALPVNGPRALALAGSRVLTAGYFSDNVVTLDLAQPAAPPVNWPLSPGYQPTPAQLGERYFNDAALCFQGWQSCASCHSSDARVDGLNWDLLNDGIGNPKNSRSMLLSHRTPPAMSQGVRESAEAAVRAGLRHILFSVQPETVAAALDDYLKSLQPGASPHLVHGQLAAAAQRGKKLFTSRGTGCADCHPPGLFTSLQAYDVGTRAPTDNVAEFDTPGLNELWRTAPFLHDGSAATVRDVLTNHNPHDQHGRTSHLTAGQLDDLVAYLLSL